MNNDSPGPSIVVARRYGQLGNRLFLYAHLIGAACEYRSTVYNPCFSEYAKLFPAIADDLWCRYPAVPIDSPKPSQRKRDLLHQSIYLGTRALSMLGLSRYPYSIVRLKGSQECDLEGVQFRSLIQRKRTILAQGWLFRSDTLLSKYGNQIRTHFQVQPQHRANVDSVISKLRETADVVVGVHIRHGDYKTFLGGKYFFSVAEYANVMRSIQQQLQGQRVAFLVCSNAKISPGDFEGLDVRDGPGHLVEDMYSFAECDVLIGPPSTYTGWASFYGRVPLSVMESTNHQIDVPALLRSGQRHAA